MITPDEKDLLTQFRSRIEDIDLDWYNGHDQSLIRWIRARDSLDESEQMLRKYLAWRKENGMESILNYEFPDNITKELPFKICGTDESGCLVGVVPFGQWDLRKFIDSGRKNILFKYIDYLFEILYKVMRNQSTPEAMITQASLILDYENFSYRQVTSHTTIQALLELLQKLESLHPEILKSGILLNAPRVFELLFRICKPFLTARTLSKVSIHGPNVHEWRSELLKKFPHKSLPSHYGGSNTTISNYQLSDGTNVIRASHRTFPENQMRTVILEGGEKLKLELNANECNSKLRWSFKTEESGIGFHLLNDCEKLIDIKKADSHVHIQNGTFNCSQNGKYTICFDNSSNRTSKKLRYVVQVSDQNIYDEVE